MFMRYEKMLCGIYGHDAVRSPVCRFRFGFAFFSAALEPEILLPNGVGITVLAATPFHLGPRCPVNPSHVLFRPQENVSR